MAAAGDPSYLALLIERAAHDGLANHPQWRALLHYRSGASGARSEVTDRRFFLSPNGERDPRAELDATLAAFFSADPPARREEPAQCAFVARYRWLVARLQIDPARLAPIDCPRFAAWYARIDPRAMTLVFPTAYLNNPASMFGQTLLRVDAHGQDEDSRLLAYAINYGADTEGDGGALFMIKGVAGGYGGYFSIGPYYDKVREYSDLQDRDIWEFRLALDAAEVRRAVEHLWELRGVRFDYYFFSDNCAYQLLTLLDVARPDLGLAEQFDAWVIPSETLRALARAGVLVEARFRPAAGTRLAERASRLRPAHVELARALGESPDDLEAQLARLGDAERTAVLALAYDYAYYRHLAARGADPARRERLAELLRAKAAGGDADPPADAGHATGRPDLGHGSAMLSLGLGRSSEADFRSLRLRPAYHELLDPGEGYKRGAQINFLDLTLRLLPAAGRVETHALTVLDIVSLAPRTRLLRPISWQLRTGWQRALVPGTERPALLWQLEGGAGLAWEPAERLMLYTFAVLAAEAGEALAGDRALGPGLRAGALWSPAPGWGLALSAGVLDYRSGGAFERTEARFELRRTLGSHQQLGLAARAERVPGTDHGEALLAWRQFF